MFSHSSFQHIFQKHQTIKTDSGEISKEESVSITFSEQLPTLKQIEQLLISEAMKRANANQSIAAQILGITRQALNKRLKKTNQLGTQSNHATSFAL